MQVESQEPVRVAIVGNHHPRQCGIATFTSDVQLSLQPQPGIENFVVAMEDGSGHRYSHPVRYVLQDSIRADYARLGTRLRDEADVILLQHEYGIFGGNAGDWILDLLDAADLPLVTTLHTILADPDPAQAQVMRALSQRSDRLVTMSAFGERMLRNIYGVAPGAISVVPHGVPDRPWVDPVVMRARLGWPQRPTIMTFGLLGPGKSIEVMIDAMQGIAAAVPDVRYMIVGVTHPNLIEADGRDPFREQLQSRIADLELSNQVEFVDRFLDLDTLCDYLQATDVYVTPYANEAQITSGTLAYSHALGKPIVSTPYWHARELLGDCPDQLVPFGDASAMEAAVLRLLQDDHIRNAEAHRAYKASRHHVWRRVGEKYARLLRAATKSSISTPSYSGFDEYAAFAPFRALRTRSFDRSTPEPVEGQEGSSRTPTSRAFGSSG